MKCFIKRLYLKRSVKHGCCAAGVCMEIDGALLSKYFSTWQSVHTEYIRRTRCLDKVVEPCRGGREHNAQCARRRTQVVQQ